MGEAYRQRFGTNSKTHRAGVWAGRVEALLSFSVVLLAAAVQANGLPEVKMMLLATLLFVPLIVILANSILLPYFLLPLQWFADDDWVVENAFKLKASGLLLIGAGLFLTATNIVWEWNGAFYWPVAIHLFVALGLAVHRYTVLHERSAQDGPADWAIAAARRIAEKG